MFHLPGSKSPVWEYLFLLAFTLLLLWPLCMGRALYWGDILLYFAPMLRLQQTALQHGQIPLWNPTILGGQPLVGNPQMGVFYPTTPLLLLLPVWLYLSVTTIGHVFLCGAFMNLYLRGWSGDRWARIAGSLVYMGSECLIGRIQFPPMIFSAPYFPLLLYCIDRCLNTQSAFCETRFNYQDNKRLSACSNCNALRIRRIREHLRLALIIGLLALAAHPQMAYLILAAGSLYAAVRLLNDGHDRQKGIQTDAPSKRSRIRQLCGIIQRAYPAAFRLISAGLLGLMLAAVQILPAVQVLLESPREKLTPAQANRFYLEPAHLLRLIFPRFWGHPATSDFWGGGNAWEPAFFIGWLPLLLIGVACVRFRKRRKVQFWIAAACVGIWLAFGNTGGLYWIAFKTVPGLSNFHDPARFLIFTTFAFAVLTTLGWQVSLAKRIQVSLAKRIHAPRYMGIIGIALPLWWVGKDWNPTVPHEFFQMRPRAATMTPISPFETDTDAMQNSKKQNSKKRGVYESNNISLRTYLPAHEQFWKHYITDGYSDYGSDDARHFQALLDTMMPNLNSGLGQESASWYEPVPLSAPAGVDALGRVALQRGEPNLSRLLAVMGARELILPQVDHTSDPRFFPATMQSPTTARREVRLPVNIQQNRDVLPRVWIARDVRHVEGKTRLSAALAAPDFHPEQTAILQDAPDALANQMEWPDIPPKQSTLLESNQEAATRVLTLDARNMEIEADCGSEPGFLLVSITAFPGWQAQVDARPASVHRADGSLMGITLPSGKHFVSLRYRPACYQWGLYLSLLAVGTLSALTGYLKIPARSQSKPRSR